MAMPNQDVVKERISNALLIDYTSIYYVDANTNEYCWFSLDEDYHALKLNPTGKDFFEDLARDAKIYVYPEDQHLFTDDFTKERFLHDMQRGDIKSIEYRLVVDGKPVWHMLRMIKNFKNGEDYYILGVINIDRLKRNRDERELFSELAVSLAEHYNTIYYVDLRNDDYLEFSSTNLFRVIDEDAVGHDFFEEAKVNADFLLHPEDKVSFLSYLEKEQLIENYASGAPAPIEYRMIIEGKEVYMRLTGMLTKDRSHIILCVENIDAEKRALEQANKDARLDSLTGLLNKRAYGEFIESIRIHIQSGFAYPFALVMCDINNLKLCNDTFGHIEGDKLIKAAANEIRNAFPGSPVYRMGGDEFIVILFNKNYENRYLLFMDFRKRVRHNAVNVSGPVIATGMAEYDPSIDKNIAEIAHRADLLMYENKNNLKKICNVPTKAYE